MTVASALSAPLEAQTTGTANLTVRVTGARNAKGKIQVALFRDSKGFPNDASQAVHGQGANIDPQTLSAQVVFAELPAGIYAVSVFHDENMNAKLDKNFMGAPKKVMALPTNQRRRWVRPTSTKPSFD